MKINTIQILRAFAAIIVLISHVFQKLSYKPFGNYYLSGQYGVDIFFILSGFLIYLTTKKDTQPITYCKKRLLRIYPVYIFAFFLYVLFGVENKPFNYSIKSFIQNIIMVPWDEGVGYNVLAVGVAWSTVFEMFFYFLFFVIVVFHISRRGIFVIIPLLFVLSQILKRFVFDDRTDIPFLSLFLSLGSSTYLFGFLIGCLICELFKSKKLPLLDKKYYTVIFCMVCLVTVCMFLFKRIPMISYAVCSLLFILTIQFENYYKLNFKSQTIKFLIYLGDTSFSIYIFHLLFIRLFIDYLHIANVVTLLILTLTSTILFSNFTYKWIEKPFIDYSKS